MFDAPPRSGGIKDREAGVRRKWCRSPKHPRHRSSLRSLAGVAGHEAHSEFERSPWVICLDIQVVSSFGDTEILANGLMEHRDLRSSTPIPRLGHSRTGADDA